MWEFNDKDCEWLWQWAVIFLFFGMLCDFLTCCWYTVNNANSNFCCCLFILNMHGHFILSCFVSTPASLPCDVGWHWLTSSKSRRPVCPLGGAISNMYAMLLARFKMFPEVKEKGMSSVPRLVAFTSEHVSIYASVQLIHIFTTCVLLDQIQNSDHSLNSFFKSNIM